MIVKKAEVMGVMDGAQRGIVLLRTPDAVRLGNVPRKNTASLLPRCERLTLHRLGSTHRKTP